MIEDGPDDGVVFQPILVTELLLTEQLMQRLGIHLERRELAHMPFDDDCIKPYSVVRAELWRMHATPKKGERQKFKEKHPEQLQEKATGDELGIDEPDLIIASIAMAQNLVLVTGDTKAGMTRVREAAERIFRDGLFPVQLRTDNWNVPIV